MMNVLEDVASLATAEVTMFITVVVTSLPMELMEPFLKDIKACVETQKEKTSADGDIALATTELLSIIHARAMAFLAANNVRTADDLTSLLFSVLLAQSEVFGKDSAVNELERLVGPKATAQIYNWFSSYGKDLSALVRPRGTTLN